MHIPIGTEISLFGSFYDATQKPPALRDPGEVEVVVRPPNGVNEVYLFSADQVERLEEGRFRMGYVPTQAGKYEYQFRGTSPVIATRRRSFHVREGI